jgi:hypothetical protein
LGGGTKGFLIGSAVGASCGFALGAFVATPTARSAGEIALSGITLSANFVGSTALRTARHVGSFVEAGYTRVRGREAYLEHEIEELRDQINRLEQRID